MATQAYNSLHTGNQIDTLIDLVGSKANASDIYTKTEIDENFATVAYYVDGAAAADTFTINELANILYPVGSIYTNSTNTNPSTYFGGTWELLPEKVFLVESVNSGNTYMRRYSDGWLEQGGYMTSSNVTEAILTFPYPFAGTNYKFWASNEQMDAGIVVYGFKPYTATQCKYVSAYNGTFYSEGTYWNAMGWGPIPDLVRTKYEWRRTA